MLRGSSQHQERVLASIGAITLACIVIALITAVNNPFGSQPPNQLAVDIDTPFVGQGISSGAAVVLHGVTVGRITDVTNRPGGGVRVSTQLDAVPARDLSDTLNIDYRPINYFGVPGINLIPGAGGQPLRNGTQLHLTPTGNFTLSQLLSRLGNVSAGSLTPELITVIDRVSRYTDSLNPLFETIVTVSKTIADVQNVATAQLLATTASIAGSFPAFSDAVITAGQRVIDFNYYPGETPPDPWSSTQKLTYPYLKDVRMPNIADETEEYFQEAYMGLLKGAQEGLFASIGKLLYSHVDDLYPLIAGLQSITDAVPPILRPQDIAQKLAELRTRFEALYAGNGEQRAISVRVVLDSLPGIAAPIGILPGGLQ